MPVVTMVPVTAASGLGIRCNESQGEQDQGDL
jgi:hypothetical protein